MYLPLGPPCTPERRAVCSYLCGGVDGEVGRGVDGVGLDFP
jgi:hypothetical protein